MSIIEKYIYKITNIINNKSYIGQTIDIERRFKEHCYNYQKDYISLINQAIKKYGKENFKIEELYFGTDYNNKEKEYIKFYNTLVPNGYNIQKGGEEPPRYNGEDHPESTITWEQANKIQTLLKEKYLTMTKIAEITGTTKDVIRHINEGNTWKNKNINYPIRNWAANVIQEDDIDKIIYMLKNTNKTQKEIAEEIGCKRSCITMINNGKNHKRENEKYPIRQKKNRTCND